MASKLLHQEYGIESTTAGLLVAFVIFMNIPGNLLGGLLLRNKFRAGRVIILAASVMGLCALGMLNTAVPNLLRYMLILVFSFIGGLIPATVFAQAMILVKSPSQRGAMNGLLQNGSNLGSFFGPLLVASVVTTFGNWYAVSWVIALIALLLLAVSVATRNWH